MFNDIGTPNPANELKAPSKDETKGYTAEAVVAINCFKYLIEETSSSMTEDYKHALSRIMAKGLNFQFEWAAIEELNDDFGIPNQEYLSEAAKGFVRNELETNPPEKPYMVTSVSVAATKTVRDQEEKVGFDAALGIVRVLFGPMVSTDEKYVPAEKQSQTIEAMWPVVKNSAKSKMSPHAADPFAKK